MVLSRRERYVAVGTLVAVAVLILDRFALSPLLGRLSAMDAEKESLRAEKKRSAELITQRRQDAPKWQEMVQAGLKSAPDDAESQVLHAINDWANEGGIALSLMKPERLTEKSRLPEIAFEASGTGTMRAVALLLWRVQTAKIPIKITEVEIKARKKGADDLAFKFRVSTVYAPRLAPAKAAGTQPDSPERAGRGGR